MTTVTLLKYGADVTITDDRGLTPVDVAKTKKMKNTLREAWVAVTKRNSHPSPEVANTSSKAIADEQIKKPDSLQKRKPEVIFDVREEVIFNIINLQFNLHC